MSSLIDELNIKRTEVIKTIKPICEAFNIEYDYIVKETGQTETLVLNGQKIGCSMNSIYAIKNEIIGYIFAKIYCRNNWWHFRPHTLKYIKQYWLN
ncbi:MAG: hypothetical protein HFJ49_03050 [Clostridia bacterium]|jgi:protein involved in sex pheromone biosynthesis|nr:hypothetical protein [Clostridia bacterium]